MNISLLGQGFESTSKNSVGNKLIELFCDKGFHTFTGISAFSSQAGIGGLGKHISIAKGHLKIITIVTGIDQKGTSKEALEALLNLNINAYIFYQPSITIFHPKIYLFEGNEKSELIIGSSNLTAQGLFTNVEGSLLINIDNSIASDRKIIEQLKEYFKGIFDFTDPNLKELSEKLISDLVEAKIVPTEAERKTIQDKLPKEGIQETQDIISKIFPKRAIANIPSEFRGTRKETVKPEVEEKFEVTSTPSELLWESGALTARDLNIPKGNNTHATGSMLFKKGNMKNIDQRHYFRDKVFATLSWSPDTKIGKEYLEKAIASFRIIVMGMDYGVFNLTITHNPRTDTRSYEQNNSMTSISWGEAKSIIAKDELKGKIACLYKDKDGFILRID